MLVKQLSFMNKSWRTVAFLLAAAIACGGPLTALSQEKPVRWQVEQPRSAVHPGVWTTLRVSARIEPTWRLYSLTQPRPPIATVISVGPAGVLRGRQAKQPAPAKKYDPNFEIESELFTGTVAFEVPVAVESATRPGKHKAFVAVVYQTCTDLVCLPPARDSLIVTLTVRPPPAGVIVPPLPPLAPGEGSGESPDPAATGSEELQRPPTAVPFGSAATPPSRVSSDIALATAAGGAGGMWAFLGLAALMGALSLLTPCVFPMIPITVAYFTGRHRGTVTARRRRESARDALVYGGGIVIAFSSLGFLLALLFGATGINRFAANPWVNLLVAALFIGFALDLLGVYNLRLPSRVLARVNGSPERGGISGLLIMGIVFAVTTFTCTVPFVGTLLVGAAAGSWVWPIAGMLVFSSVFAIPFFVLALVPQMLGSLPRSGSWMRALMITLGLVEIGAAFKFLSNVDLVWQLGILHRPVVISIWIALALLISFYLLGQIKLSSDYRGTARSSIGFGRLLFGGSFLAITFFLASGLFGRSLGEIEAFLPPHVYPGDEIDPRSARALEGSQQLAWFTSYADGLEEARATNRPVFVDFTGFTCTNCRWMEANVFARDDIQKLLSSYVLVRLYTDGRGEKYAQNRELQLKRFGTVAMPLYAILDPAGESVATLAGLTRNSEKFASFLKGPLKDLQVALSPPSAPQ